MSEMTTRRQYNIAFSLPEQIAEHIAEEILEDRITPGARLKETEIAAQFGVSRAPVREALRILETQKLVRLTPQRGAVVTTLSLEELGELFAIRGALMGLSMRKIAETGSEADHASLVERVGEIERHVIAGDMTMYARQLGELSEYSAELAGPGWIRDLLILTVHQTVKFSRRGLMSGAAADQIVAAWRALALSVSRRDADESEAGARRLMDIAWRLAKPALESLHTLPKRG